MMEEILESAKLEEHTKKLVQLGFKEAPLAIKGELAYPGALLNYSLRVHELLVKKNDELNLELNNEELVILSFFHKLNKVSSYQLNLLKSGEQSQAVPYKTDVQLPLGSAETSLILALNLLGDKLTNKLALAIRWHRLWKDPSYSQNRSYIEKHEYYKVIVALATSSLEATI